MLHVHAAIHLRVFLIIICQRRLLVVIETSKRHFLSFRSCTLSQLPTKFPALQSPSIVSKARRQYASPHVAMTPLKRHSQMSIAFASLCAALRRPDAQRNANLPLVYGTSADAVRQPARFRLRLLC